MKKLLEQIKKNREYIRIDKLLSKLILDIESVVHDYRHNNNDIFFTIDGIKVITGTNNFLIYFNGCDIDIVKQRIMIYFNLGDHVWSMSENNNGI